MTREELEQKAMEGAKKALEDYAETFQILKDYDANQSKRNPTSNPYRSL